MKKIDLFAKLKYRLCAKYPDYDFELKPNALIMNSKDYATVHCINVPILRYEKETDKMILSFPELSKYNYASSQVKEYITPSIDTYRLDYYNVNENHIDYIVENLFSEVIQKQVKKYESMKKDFEG